jgi:hypothetical protein
MGPYHRTPIEVSAERISLMMLLAEP